MKRKGMGVIVGLKGRERRYRKRRGSR